MEDETKVEEEEIGTPPESTGNAPVICTNCDDSGKFCKECSSKEVE